MHANNSVLFHFKQKTGKSYIIFCKPCMSQMAIELNKWPWWLSWKLVLFVFYICLCRFIIPFQLVLISALKDIKWIKLTYCCWEKIKIKWFLLWDNYFSIDTSGISAGKKSTFYLIHHFWNDQCEQFFTWFALER